MLSPVLDLLQLIFSLLVIVLTAWRLTDFDVEGTSVSSSCLLDGSKDSGFLTGTQFCAYAIVVGVVSFLVTAIFGCIRKIFKCITLNVCGASRIISVIGDIAVGVWWTVAFVLFVRRGRAANNLGWPERTARDGVIAASFGAMVAFYADAIVTIFSMVL